MTEFLAAHRRLFLRIIGALAIPCIFTGCNRPDRNRMQGYVEGEFIYVASPSAGRLESLNVRKGSKVKAGDPLFTLENIPEMTMRDEAERRLEQSRSNLEDAKKGGRPSEMESFKAQIEQAKAALKLSEVEFDRQDRLVREGAVSVQNLDRARAARDENRHRVARIEADLKTAGLGARKDQIAAAESNVRAQISALERTRWNLSQKHQTAPKSGMVFDTLFREGEWVGAGRPVVALLPSENIKVRAFVPEKQIGRIRPLDRVSVFVDGVDAPFSGKISFISPQAEYTPPVIYSRENRSKMVFMIEATFDPGVAENLHPGQPVDVQFND